MKIYFHKNFTKQLRKLSVKERTLVQECLELFLLDHFHPRLRNHPLKGKYLNYRSINIRPDLRALYREIGYDEVVFVVLGTHSKLYR